MSGAPNHAEMRAIAEKAAEHLPGEWLTNADNDSPSGVAFMDADGDETRWVTFAHCSGGVLEWLSASDHIATFDPPTCIALLDENAALRDRAEKADALLDETRLSEGELEQAARDLDLKIEDLTEALQAAESSLAALQARVAELEGQINTPELHDFAKGVVLEAAHQRERWGSEHDTGKEPQDWFWLLGYLGGKALKAAADGDHEKALHHTISTAAALANWHAAILGASNLMRPGFDPTERGIDPVFQAALHPERNSHG